MKPCPEFSPRSFGPATMEVERIQDRARAELLRREIDHEQGKREMLTQEREWLRKRLAYVEQLIEQSAEDELVLASELSDLT